MTVPVVLAAVADGVRLGVQFNPLFATIGSAIAAALLGYPKAPVERRFTAGAVIVIAWLTGDGLRILGRARDTIDGIGALGNSVSGWSLLGLWALVSIALGYVLPMLVGVAVGRRVTFGTGWLAAATIAIAVSLALATLLGGITF
ncbi:MAG: hypothetical protein WBI63_01875 [Coriobacteriia bacterium]